MEPFYLETGVPEADRARGFFAELFDWPYTAVDNGGYFDAGAFRMGIHGDDPRPAIVVYFEVTDIEKAITMVRALGGEAANPSPEEPGFGRFATCADPQGVRFGLRQSTA